ncbi:MAG: hypothetical protein ACYDDU_14725 [Dermatophilaceae bacterium]
MINPTAASIEKTVERRDRIFVHSERMTRACVTFFPDEVRERVGMAVAGPVILL